MRILIIGAGLVGSLLARKFSEAGHSVTIIDKNEERIVRLGGELDVEALVKDATNPSVYEELDISSYDVVIAATDRDEVNLFVAAIARLYNVSKIYVRTRNVETGRLLDVLGVTGIVPEPALIASLFYSMIEGSYHAIDLIPALAGDFILVSATVRAVSPIRGKWIRNLYKEGLLDPSIKILAVYDGRQLLDPREAPPLDVGHTVIALLRKDRLKDFNDLF